MRARRAPAGTSSSSPTATRRASSCSSPLTPRTWFNRLFIEPPFDSLTIACAINVYRLDVSSTESGADKPDCSDGGGDGSSRATYFDSTFCFDGDTQRLLYGNRALAEDTVSAHLPQWHQIIVICNDPERGGGGGTPAHPVGWTSNSSSDWREAAIHEMGHSAFGLADEYDVDGEDDSYSGDDFDEPNVSNDPDPATVKWSALVTAGATVPTLANPDCTQPSAGTDSAVVGTFEGANHYHCGAYRPVHRCKMRESTAPFCPVCSGVIVNAMQPFAVPAPSGGISLATPVVDFNDVPTGLSVVRAARFDVESCFAVIFQVMDTPAAPFALESPSFVIANPSGPTPWKGYVWFRMTCPGSVGPATPQAITIRSLETGEDFEVTLTGNCVARPTLVTQLVFDRSASMLDLTDEGRTKEAVLKESASAFVDLLYDDNGIGINAYDHDPHPVMDIDVADAPGAGGGRDAAVGAISSFAANPAGLTAIGDGIELAKQRLDAASGYDEKAMIVLTDGIETADKRIADVADTVINEKVFAIGLGTAEQIRPQALDALTAGTGGYLLMTGNLSSDETFLLSKYYLQILAGVNNDDLVLDPEGSLHFAGRADPVRRRRVRRRDRGHRARAARARAADGARDAGRLGGHRRQRVCPGPLDGPDGLHASRPAAARRRRPRARGPLAPPAGDREEVRARRLARRGAVSRLHPLLSERDGLLESAHERPGGPGQPGAGGDPVRAGGAHRVRGAVPRLRARPGPADPARRHRDLHQPAGGGGRDRRLRNDPAGDDERHLPLPDPGLRPDGARPALHR